MKVMTYETWKLKLESGKLQNWVRVGRKSGRVVRIRPSSSRSVATAHSWTRFHLVADRGFTWELAAPQQQIAEMRTAHGSRLDGFDMAATDRVLWWLVADLRVAATLFSCLCLFSCLNLWVVICEVVADSVCVCVRFTSDCAACVCDVQLVCVMFCFVLFCHSVCVLCKCAACDLCCVCAATEQRMCVWLCAVQLVTCVCVLCSRVCVCGYVLCAVLGC